MQDIDFDRGNWAVVTATSGKRYIGYFHEEDSAVMKGWEERTPLLLAQAFEFTTTVVPVRGPQGETGMQRLSQCSPPNNCISPEAIWLRPGDIQFFSDMADENLTRHKGLVEQAMAQSMAARVEASGLTLPSLRLSNG